MKIAPALIALIALTQCTATEAPPDQPQFRPDIQLMTSLPLVWGDSASMQSILSGDTEPAPIYKHWQDQYEMVAVDSLENLAEENPGIVILAQPRPMDPADLAILDAWVRMGGDVIILTDPDLVWPSELPLGDKRRPLAIGLLSPLLGHWGLEMVAASESPTKDVALDFGSFSLVTRGVGKLQPLSDGAGSGLRCTPSAANFIMQCSVGKGQATIVADADFLNVALWPERERRSPQNSGAGRFIDSLVDGHIQRGGNQK